MPRPRSGPALPLLLTVLGARVASAVCGATAGELQALAEARAAIEAVCPCADATSTLAYRRCVRGVIAARVAASQLSRGCGHKARRCAARSTCGRPGAVACCQAGRPCRLALDVARCEARGGTPGPWSSCCDACAPRPTVAFASGPCPSRAAPSGCPAATAPTCHEAFVSDPGGELCHVGPNDRATTFTPEDGVADGGRSRAWSFAVRPRSRAFHASYPEVTGSLRLTADGSGQTGTSLGASDAAHFRLTTDGPGGLLLTLRWFTAGLPAGVSGGVRLAQQDAALAEIAEGPGAATAGVRNTILTWVGGADVSVSASLTGPRDTPVPSADLLWQLAFLELAADDDHDGIPNRADPHPLDRAVPRQVARPPRPRVLVVGLDAAAWTLMDPLMAAGYLPTIGSLVQSGARAFLDETPADPSYCCFCPPVWTSLATGQPLAIHAMAGINDEPWDRPVPSIWALVERAGGTSSTVAFRNTAPPEPGTTYAAGIDGVLGAAALRFNIFPVPTPPEERAEGMNRLQWTWPPLLFETLGLLPHGGPRPELWIPFASDQTSAAILDALATHEPTDLSVILFHSPDKSEHVRWCTVQAAADQPVDIAALLAQAAAWTGPIGAHPYGEVASQYLETDLLLSRHFTQAAYDYVVIASDHGMTFNTGGGIFCGRHETPPAFHGVFALAGPGVRAGADLGTMSVLDVAPTLAYLLDLPVATDLPGRVVVEAFTPEHLASHPIRLVAHW